MLTVAYPIAESTERVRVHIGQIEPDPLSIAGDQRVLVQVEAPNGYKFAAHIHGIDALQCVWLAVHTAKGEIARFEEWSGLRCEYTAFSGDEYLSAH